MFLRDVKSMILTLILIFTVILYNLCDFHALFNHSQVLNSFCQHCLNLKLLIAVLIAASNLLLSNICIAIILFHLLYAYSLLLDLTKGELYARLT